MVTLTIDLSSTEGGHGHPGLSCVSTVGGGIRGRQSPSLSCVSVEGGGRVDKESP